MTHQNLASNPATAKDLKTTWPCPAKINLFLHIIGQRPDGYHNLQSIFQLLDYSDQLTIETLEQTTDKQTTGEQDTIHFDCNLKELVSPDNLVIKAAKRLQQEAKKQGHKKILGAKLFLEKKLPIGGGLGGGSSNAATTLVALNYLWKLNLSLDSLIKIGLSLGADVPIFILGKTAFVEGIGEKLTPLPITPKWYLVLQPHIHVSTIEIFNHPLLTRNSKTITIRDLEQLALPAEGKNDMQTIVCDVYPKVKQALNWLKQLSPNARMTGSGSCLFAVFDKYDEASKIAALCEWPCFIAKGIDSSPIHTKIKALK